MGRERDIFIYLEKKRKRYHDYYIYGCAASDYEDFYSLSYLRLMGFNVGLLPGKKTNGNKKEMLW